MVSLLKPLLAHGRKSNAGTLLHPTSHSLAGTAFLCCFLHPGSVKIQMSKINTVSCSNMIFLLNQQVNCAEQLKRFNFATGCFLISNGFIVVYNVYLGTKAAASHKETPKASLSILELGICKSQLKLASCGYPLQCLEMRLLPHKHKSPFKAAARFLPISPTAAVHSPPVRFAWP